MTVEKKGEAEMDRVPDNYDAWKIHERRKELELEKQPICAWCNEHIPEDYGYRVGNDLVCEECINNLKERIN